MFIHQFSHLWLDFRGMNDARNREVGYDYFENSRRATRVHRAYATENPHGFVSYSENGWGLTASDGPGPEVRIVDVCGAVHHAIERLALKDAERQSGFDASFNPTFPVPTRHLKGWVSPWKFGLNEGPVIVMIENHLSGLVWSLFRRCPYALTGLRRAGFEGGWLDSER